MTAIAATLVLVIAGNHAPATNGYDTASAHTADLTQGHEALATFVYCADETEVCMDFTLDSAAIDEARL